MNTSTKDVASFTMIPRELLRGRGRGKVAVIMYHIFWKLIQYLVRMTLPSWYMSMAFSSALRREIYSIHLDEMILRPGWGRITNCEKSRFFIVPKGR